MGKLDDLYGLSESAKGETNGLNVLVPKHA